ncbi:MULTISPECIES: thiamine diphosphokinase [Bifidobacterium]|jgi:thiamine pyrophosphokinase|uniref:Thiamine diphosphokinase n=1 Tax=Bifidobacterium tibiigranuli TaxID=2172043 RepID=A0A5N6S0L6_9BIFI|nr:thiamine diphosphokinase [Bifidobacterium tibiigranuli]KAE8128085.1 thiamine diphosphokinase [Bifidobacterium tibiigranuli]KAE8128246.1 thiamine diphosphokinase [Bifidobacterium tibiigranuli]MCH3974015.1 thiamine diphosphokinase [Bifidobacterium tibiigranuli]MCH4204005.1 thiamine diphosphokinase [Bifidobacterium tibiigranuli]MCH4274488.1 thiamine diphosphokinase [Bifidobacterium tibiigranuli]
MNQTNHVCVIFAAGQYYGPTPGVPADLLAGLSRPLVIAADAGLDHARAEGVSADIVIGDFDSVQGSVPDDDRTLRLPALKDDPDMLSALKVGWNRGARELHILGGLGGRIDHTIANIQLMGLLAQHGGVGFLYGDGAIVTAITDGELAFEAHDAMPGGMVSVFAQSDMARDVNEPGLKYQLRHATLTNSVVQGVSNEFLPGVASAINVHDGTLIVTFPITAPMPRITRYREFTGDLGPLDTEISPILDSRFTNRAFNR